MSDKPEITQESTPVITEVADDAPAVPSRMSGLAIAGFVLVLLCPMAIMALPGTRVTPLLCYGLATIGLVACAVGWGVIGRSGGRLRGVPLAASGILLAMAFIAILSLLGRLDATSKRNSCLRNQQQLGIALSQYAQDNGRFPTDWTALRAYVGRDIDDATAVWSCPTHPVLDPRPGTSAYGLNAAVAGHTPAAFSDPATLVLTADANRDRIETDADLARARHGASFVAAFADGHAWHVGRFEAVRLAP